MNIYIYTHRGPTHALEAAIKKPGVSGLTISLTVKIPDKDNSVKPQSFLRRNKRQEVET